MSDGRGTTVALAPPMARFSLRAREAGALEAVLGTLLPRRIGETLGNLACLGPDEWLWRGEAGTVLAGGEGVSVVDVSDRAVCLIVAGPRAAEVLMAGCPLDLDRFAVGRATRTVFETVEIIVLRTAEERFEVEVWRSFAPWLKAAQDMAASYLRTG